MGKRRFRRRHYRTVKVRFPKAWPSGKMGKEKVYPVLMLKGDSPKELKTFRKADNRRALGRCVIP